MLAVRSALFNVLFYLVLIVLMLAGLPTMLFGRHAVLRMANIWGKASLLLLRWICGTRVEFRGLDNVPSQACIIASKHQSFIEIIAFASLYSDFTFVLKRELTRIPLFGWYLAQSDQIAIDRASGRSALTQVSRMAKIVLAEGRQVFIFPEGTRRPPGAAPDYKFGVAYLYNETGATCVPVALNSGLFWPRRSFIRRPGTIVLQFLEPIGPGLDTSRVPQSAPRRHRVEQRRPHGGSPGDRSYAAVATRHGARRTRSARRRETALTAFWAGKRRDRD